MGKQKQKIRKEKQKRQQRAIAKASSILSPVPEKKLVPKALEHKPLANNLVHVFVDDQNIFWDIVNNHSGIGYRIDFGKLLFQATGEGRGVGTAFIAGVIPDDDSFWQIAKDQGFEVKRGYLGANNRSKQDDAYLVTEMTKTIYEKPGPSTIILVAGDADYYPPLQNAVEKGWRVEVIHVSNKNVSSCLEPVCHKFLKISPESIRYTPR